MCWRGGTPLSGTGVLLLVVTMVERGCHGGSVANSLSRRGGMLRGHDTGAQRQDTRLHWRSLTHSLQQQTSWGCAVVPSLELATSYLRSPPNREYLYHPTLPIPPHRIFKSPSDRDLKSWVLPFPFPYFLGNQERSLIGRWDDARLTAGIRQRGGG